MIAAQGARLSTVAELAPTERLLVWTLRRIIATRDRCPAVIREYADQCGDDAGEVLATVRAFLMALGYAARRRISIGHPGCCALTGDERQILDIVGAGQMGDRPRLAAHVCWLTRSEARQQVVIAAQALGSALSAHDLIMSPAAAAARLHRSRSGGLRLVS